MYVLLKLRFNRSFSLVANSLMKVSFIEWKTQQPMSFCNQTSGGVNLADLLQKPNVPSDVASYTRINVTNDEV